MDVNLDPEAQTDLGSSKTMIRKTPARPPLNGTKTPNGLWWPEILWHDLKQAIHDKKKKKLKQFCKEEEAKIYESHSDVKVIKKKNNLIAVLSAKGFASFHVIFV